MSKNKKIKFFVVMFVIISVVGIGGKHISAERLMSSKVKIELRNNLKIKETMKNFHEQFQKNIPRLKKVIKNKSYSIMIKVIKKKNEMIKNTVDKAIEKLIQISESI